MASVMGDSQSEPISESPKISSRTSISSDHVDVAIEKRLKGAQWVKTIFTGWCMQAGTCEDFCELWT